jgi:hypothetical protein
MGKNWGKISSCHRKNPGANARGLLNAGGGSAWESKLGNIHLNYLISYTFIYSSFWLEVVL